MFFFFRVYREYTFNSFLSVYVEYNFIVMEVRTMEFFCLTSSLFFVVWKKKFAFVIYCKI